MEEKKDLLEEKEIRDEVQKMEKVLTQPYLNVDYFREKSRLELAIKLVYAFESYHVNYGYNEFPEHLYEKLKEYVNLIETSLPIVETAVQSGVLEENMLSLAKLALKTGKNLLSTTEPLIFMRF